jgi:hypothetical protein
LGFPNPLVSSKSGKNSAASWSVSVIISGQLRPSTSKPGRSWVGSWFVSLLVKTISVNERITLKKTVVI